MGDIILTTDTTVINKVSLIAGCRQGQRLMAIDGDQELSSGSPLDFAFVEEPIAGISYLASSINYNVSDSAGLVHLGDNGVIIDLLLVNGNDVLDTDLYSFAMVFKKPLGGIIEKGGHVSSPGRIRCVLWSNDLDEAGVWKVQPVVSGNGKVVHGSVEIFRVLENL
jgi:hypothetical protein